MENQLQWFAKTGCIGAPVRNLIVGSFVGDGILPGQDRLHDRHVLPCLAQGFAVRASVPPLNHLRTGQAEAEKEAATGELAQRCRRHGRHRRSTCRHLHDAGANLDVVGLRGVPGEHAHDVAPVGLGSPERVVAEAIRLLDQRQIVCDVRTRVPDIQCQSHPCSPSLGVYAREHLIASPPRR